MKLLVHTLSPEGELLPSRHRERRDDEDGHRWWIPPAAGFRNGIPRGFWWLQRLAAEEFRSGYVLGVFVFIGGFGIENKS